MKLKKSVLSTALSTVLMGASFNASSGSNISDMQGFFNEIGVFGNAQAPASFRGQTRNYLSGGSLSMRIPQKNYQLATFDPPRISASCGGIDAFAGAFSFINSEQLVQMLQNIGNNAAGALFSMALESVSPQLNAVMKFFQDQAAKMNNLNINSCQAAKGIVTASASGKLQSAFENQVKGLGSNVLGTGDDWSDMVQSFQDQSSDTSKTVAEGAQNSPSLSEGEKLWMNGGNVLYEALNKLTVDGGALSDEEKRLIQAIVGTVIVRPESVDGQTKLKSELIMPTISEPLDYLVGEANTDLQYKAYKCEAFSYGSISKPASSCMQLSGGGTGYNTYNYSIKSLRKVIHERIKAVEDKVVNRQAITAADYNIVNISHLPVWDMIVNKYRSGGAIKTLDNSEYIISLDYVKAMLQRVGQTVDIALTSMQKTENEGIAENVKQLREQIDTVRKQVNTNYASQISKYHMYLASMQTLRMEAEKVRMLTSQRISMTKNSMVR